MRYGRPPKCVVYLECRELVAPENVGSMPHEAVYDVEGPDGRQWTLGMTKGLRYEMVEWMLEHPEYVRGAFLAARRENAEDGVDGFGRPL